MAVSFLGIAPRPYYYHSWTCLYSIVNAPIAPANSAICSRLSQAVFKNHLPPRSKYCSTSLMELYVDGGAPVVVTNPWFPPNVVGPGIHSYTPTNRTLTPGLPTAAAKLSTDNEIAVLASFSLWRAVVVAFLREVHSKSFWEGFHLISTIPLGILST